MGAFCGSFERPQLFVSEGPFSCRPADALPTCTFAEPPGQLRGLRTFPRKPSIGVSRIGYVAFDRPLTPIPLLGFLRFFFAGAGGSPARARAAASAARLVTTVAASSCSALRLL